jgi:excisionase family DNA binding protein
VSIEILLYLNWYNKNMSSQLLTLNEAADRLNVSRRRVEAMVLSGQLPADRHGRQWAIPFEGLQAVKNNRVRFAGRPLSEQTSWKIIRDGLNNKDKFDRDELDLLRRRLRSRAQHIDCYVHPGIVKRIVQDSRGVLGGRLAAIDSGAPFDSRESVDVYISGTDSSSFANDYAVRPSSVRPNLFLHIVDGDALPFETNHKFTDRFTAWLDLADRDDRAADTLLDQIAGGRMYA